MNRINVLFIETGSGYGGTGKYLYEMMCHLNREKISAHVIYAGKGNYIAKAKQLGLPMKQMNLTYQVTGLPVLSYLHMAFWFFTSALPNSIRIAREIRSKNIQIVYLNNEILSHIPSIIAAVRTGRKIVCHNHGLRRLTFIERLCAHYIDLIICVSHATAKVTKDCLPREQRIEVVHNGLDIQAYNVESMSGDPLLNEQRQDHFLVGIFGRIVAWKGHECFIEAAKYVLEKNNRVTFVIIGDDVTEQKTFLNKLKQDIVKLRLNDKIIFTGWQQDVMNFVASLDVVVQPSVLPEPFGFTVIESMALGKAVIGSRMGALPELIEEGKDGLLFDPGNAQDLAEKILFLLERAELRAEIGVRARKKISECFRLERTVRNVEERLVSL